MARKKNEGINPFLILLVLIVVFLFWNYNQTKESYLQAQEVRSDIAAELTNEPSKQPQIVDSVTISEDGIIKIETQKVSPPESSSASQAQYIGKVIECYNKPSLSTGLRDLFNQNPRRKCLDDLWDLCLENNNDTECKAWFKKARSIMKKDVINQVQNFNNVSNKTYSVINYSKYNRLVTQLKNEIDFNLHQKDPWLSYERLKYYEEQLSQLFKNPALGNYVFDIYSSRAVREYEKSIKNKR